MRFNYQKTGRGLESIIYLLKDLGLITDFHITGNYLVGIQINGVDYGDMIHAYYVTS